MNAQQAIINAAGTFDTPAQAILARCEQSGLQLRVEGEHLKAKGHRETIAAWQALIQRHKPEVIAALTGQPSPAIEDAIDLATLAADYEELTICITELCRLVGYSDDARERMLDARRSLTPAQVAQECAYFRWQVIRARIGTYWDKDALRAANN